MTAAEERTLLNDMATVLQHVKAINGATQKNTDFRDGQPKVCEGQREKLWTAINRIRLAIVIVALGGGTAGGIITKLAGLW